MKHLFLVILIFISFSAICQTDQLLTYKNSIDSFSFQYPAQWDSTTFSKLKLQFKVDFGAFIKSGFNDNKTGGYFTYKKSKSYSENLAFFARESEAALKEVYPDAIIIESKQKMSKNNITYYSLKTQINQFGSIRITNEIYILKNNKVYTFSFTSPEKGFEKLNTYFESIIDSFKFLTE